MIRRNRHGDWLIIDQVEHARLAGELAAVWGNERVQGVPPFPKIVWGVTHHDDGWSEWDKAPRLDPETGFPRSFMEMRMGDSTAIWTRSISVCSADPMAGIGVSRHFCYLAEQALKHRPTQAENREVINRFLQEQALVQSRLKEIASSNDPRPAAEQHLEKNCHRAFRTIRFFDAISLWLCCAEQDQPETFTAPLGDAIQFEPIDSHRIVADPYPLSCDSLHLQTPARRVPARRYASDDEFQRTLRAAAVEQLGWTIAPV